MKKSTVTVPTSTLLAAKPGSAAEIVLIRPTKKHEGKLTLPGGLGQQGGVECAEAEWDEECGGRGATIYDLNHFATALDPNRDIREITWGKFQHGNCDPELADVPVTARYGCPDTIFTCVVNGEPYPKDGEAKECFFADVNDLDITELAVGHDVIIAVYRQFLRDGEAPPSFALMDFAKTRRLLEEGNGQIDYTRLSRHLFSLGHLLD